MVHIEIIQPEANAGEIGSMTTSTSSGVQPNLGTSKTDGTAKAETEPNNDDDTPLIRLARVVKVSIQTGFVDSAMLLSLEKAYNPTPSVDTEAEVESTDNIAAQASDSTIIGPNNNIIRTANDADTKFLFGQDMWETLARRAWPKCGEMFFTEISKMTTYRDLFVKGLTSDGRNGGWFEKLSADIGGGRAALEYYTFRSNLFDEIHREGAGEDATDTIEVVLAALTYLKELEYPQRHDDDEDDDGEDDESVNEEDDHYSRAMIALDTLPNLVGLLKSAAVPASVQGGALYLLSRIKFVEDIVSAGAIQPTVNLLGSSDDPKVQYSCLLLLCAISLKDSSYCNELFQASIVKAMLSHIERKKSSFGNQAAPAEGLLLPDDGIFRGDQMLQVWSCLLQVLTIRLHSSEISGMVPIIPCLTSLIGEPLFYLSGQGPISRAVDSMLSSVLNLSRSSNKSTKDVHEIRSVFVNSGILDIIFGLLNEGLDNGISQERLATTLSILDQGFTAPGQGNHVQAIVDAGFLDIAIALLGGDHGVNVMVATCHVLKNIFRLSFDYIRADFCAVIVQVALEASGEVETALLSCIHCLLETMRSKSFGSTSSPIKQMLLFFPRADLDVETVNVLVDKLIETGIVELLLRTLKSSNDETVISALCSVYSILITCAFKDGKLKSECAQQIPGPLIATLKSHENKEIRKVSSWVVEDIYPELPSERIAFISWFRIFCLRASIFIFPLGPFPKILVCIAFALFCISLGDGLRFLANASITLRSELVDAVWS